MADMTPMTRSEHRLALEKENSRHDRVLGRLRDRLHAYQRDCPHSRTRFVPDASGNNDSYHECLDCGIHI